MNQLYNKKRFHSEVEKDLNKENYKKNENKNNSVNI